MLSRLLSRSSSIGTRSISRVAAPSLTRTFKTAPILSQSATPAAKADLNPAEIVSKYGTTTFVGMVAAILVSKEIFILDAEFLLSLEIGAFAMTAYVLTGDTINKMSEEQDATATKQFNGANDFMIEMFNQYKMVQSTVQNKPEVMKQYAAEYKQAIEAHAAYSTVKPQHEARAKVLAALEQFKVKEEHEAAMEWQNNVDRAVANVTKAFTSNDAKLNDQMIELAIANLGFTKPATTEDNDPVKKMFLKEFE